MKKMFSMMLWHTIKIPALILQSILYTGQPAVDMGGVSRHFFSQPLQVISQMFFQGTNYKSPIYNADIVASGMMKYIGTIIVHSILLGGPEFPMFTP